MYSKRINFAVNPVGSLRTDLRVLPLRVEKDSFPHRLVPLESRDNALVVTFFIIFVGGRTVISVGPEVCPVVL